MLRTLLGPYSSIVVTDDIMFSSATVGELFAHHQESKMRPTCPHN